MPQIANILSEKYYNQFTNGAGFVSNLSDYTPNLTGGVGEKVKAVVQLSVQWYSNSDSFNTWLVEANQITRFSGSFRDDGFAIGNVFKYISGWSTDRTSPVEFTGTISAISTDGTIISFAVNSGVVPTGTQDDAGIRADATASANYLTAFFWRFGLVGNQESYSNQSNVSGNNATFWATGVGTDSGGRSTSPVALTPQGTYRDWLSGSAYVAFVSNTDYEQIFEVSHEFIITPFYLEGQLSDLQNTVLPDYLQGENTLKYTYQAELRTVLSNPNTAIVATLENNLGSVGWFGENFNGLGNGYAVAWIAYTNSDGDSVEGLQSFDTTTVEIRLEKVGGSFSTGQKAGVMVAYLAPQSQYQNTTTNLEENFLLEWLYHTNGGAVSNGTIITNLSSTITGVYLDITFDVDYTLVQRGTISGGSYLIGVQLADATLSAPLSDRVVLLADASDYESNEDVPGLISFTQFDLHFADSVAGIDTGTTNFEGANEDSLAIEFEFYLDLAKDAVLNTMQFALIAYNTATGDTFDLDSTELNLSATISSGVQQINIDTERAYNFDSGNQYRRVTLQTDNRVGDLQYYSGVFAQKLRWEKWLRNLAVDTVFYNSTEPNQNLNFKSSNYSALNDYQIKLAVRANVSGTNGAGQTASTDYLFITPDILVSDYNSSGFFTCHVETFRASNNSNLNGAILKGEDTLLRATISTTLGAIADISNYNVIFRIQVKNDAGQRIEEISTYYYGSGGVLKPKDGFSFVDLYIDSGSAVAECLIDGSIESGSYLVTCRVDGTNPPTPITEYVLFMNGDAAQFMSDDLAKFLDQ